MRTFSQEHFVGTHLGPCPSGPPVKVSYSYVSQTVCKGYQRTTLGADNYGQKWALKNRKITLSFFIDTGLIDADH